MEDAESASVLDHGGSDGSGIGRGGRMDETAVVGAGSGVPNNVTISPLSQRERRRQACKRNIAKRQASSRPDQP